MTKKKFTRELLIPCLTLVLLTLLFRLTDWDISLAGLFYSQSRGWFLEDVWIVEFLHRFGAVPALIVSFGALCVFVGGLKSKTLSRSRKTALYCVLVFAIGSGLVVNLLLKNQWGRPRPNQIEAFGGEKEYLPVWAKGDCQTCKSFPCGDASAGFFFLFLFFALRRTSRPAAAGFLILGIGYGGLLGLCRMARGAHFASDVIWSGGIMYMTCLAFYYSLQMHLRGRAREGFSRAIPRAAGSRAAETLRRLPGPSQQALTKADFPPTIDPL